MPAFPPSGSNLGDNSWLRPSEVDKCAGTEDLHLIVQATAHPGMYLVMALHTQTQISLANSRHIVSSSVFQYPFCHGVS